MATYEKAHIDQIASNQWPHWIPIRPHFGIEPFGINLRRGQEDGTVIPEHDHAEHGEPELYYTVDGHATFTIGGEEVDAPTGTCLWISDAWTARSATARDPGTLVLSVGAGPPGTGYEPPGWDSHYLDGDKELGTLGPERPGPGAPRGFKTRTVVQPTARSVRLRRRSARLLGARV